jgi:hypothetical protein
VTDEDAENGDIDIEMSDEQAARPLTVGEFVEFTAFVQNRLSHLAMAVLHLAQNEQNDFVSEMMALGDLGAQSNALLDRIAQGQETDHDGD